MNYFSFLTKVDLQSRTEKMNIWKVFNTNFWLIIIAFYLCCVVFNILVTRNQKRENILEKLLSSIYIYYQTLLNGGDCRKPFNLIYLFWIIGIFPLIEVFKNDLSSNLVIIKERRMDTVQELLDSKFTIFFHSSTIQFWDQIFPIDPQNELSIRMNSLKSQAMSFNDMNIYFGGLRDKSADQILNELNKFVVSTHEHNLRVTLEFLGRYSTAHMAEEQYLLTMITPFCHRPDFKHEKLAQSLYELKFNE